METPQDLNFGVLQVENIVGPIKYLVVTIVYTGRFNLMLNGILYLR